MKNKIKTMFFLLVLFLITLCIGVYIVTLNQTEKTKIILEKNLLNLKVNYELITYNKKLKANSIFNSLIYEEDILNIITKANKTKNKITLKKLRNNLYNLLEKNYKQLVKEGILQLHFVLPNNRTLLRMHKKSKFDDDLIDIRKDIAHVNKTKKPVYGFYRGKTAHSFKNIIPIFYKKEYIGLVDIAFSSKYLQNYLNNISKIHTHFLVNKNLFSVKAWKQNVVEDKYLQSREHKNYMITLSKHIDIKRYTNKEITSKLTTKISNGMLKNEPFTIYNKNNEHESNAIVFYPVKSNINNNILAWMVSYERNNELLILKKDKKIIITLLFIFLSIIFIFIFKIILDKNNLKSLVDKKTHELLKANKELEFLNSNLKKTISKEVIKNIEVQDRLFKSEHLASMGEMVSNIAHQWRQPLSTITAYVSTLIVKQKVNLLDEKELLKSFEGILENARYLSSTIDDFRNFSNLEKNKEKFSLNENMKSLINIVSPTLKSNKIKLITDFTDMELDSYPNELNQCLVNIINNAKDALVDKTEDKRFIFISTYYNYNSCYIRIKDTGTGIPKNVINKIFDPYFTTKHKSVGTGLGLNMAYKIITEHLNGEIIVKNVKFIYEEKEYSGAEFIINLMPHSAHETQTK